MRDGKVSFYIGFRHKDIKEKLSKEIEALEKQKIRYSFFEDPDLLLPVMCYEGSLVAGLSNISFQLKTICR